MNATTGSKPWQAPPELARARPRPVRLTAAGWAGVCFSLALAGGAWFAGFGLYRESLRDRAARERLASAGVVAQARVTDLGRSGRGDKTRYFVIYEYQGPAGALYRRRFNLRRGHRRSLQAGAALPVRYLPGEPERSWPVGYEPRGVPVWAALVGPAALLLPAVLITYRLRRQWWLLEEGRPASARVTGSRKVHVGDHPAQRVEFEFPILSGARRTGHYDVRRNPPAAGTQFTLLYDPDDPGRNARYPLSLVRVG